MKRVLSLLIATFYTNTCFISVAEAAMNPVRIKDIVSFEGVRPNQLVGYGLVVGLNGTGDTVDNNPYTKESLTGMLERLGVNVRGVGSIGSKTVAAVMVLSLIHI